MKPSRIPRLFASCVAGVLCSLIPSHASAVIDGVSGSTFNLTVKTDRVTTPDSNSIFFWGFANVVTTPEAAAPQYPGPTLIVNQGDVVTINLTNQLPAGGSGESVSIVFPGQDGVVASGGVGGVLTREACRTSVASCTDAEKTVSYSFTASRPGTYLYHSGTHPDLQVEMGLVGAIIVRPAAGGDHAYNHPDTRFDREYLFLLTEMDPRIHETVEFGTIAELSDGTLLSDYFPVYWFINGRGAPDTMAEPGVGWFPTQPYNALPRMHPGERLLMRVIGAGRDLHPFHHHGNHARVIARDGRVLESAPGAGPDLSFEGFTIQSVPGQTVDAIFEWTGARLGWDIYGSPTALGPAYSHTCDGNPAPPPTLSGPVPADRFDSTTHEYCPDHDKSFPVALPQLQDLVFGGFWSGSPYLGVLGSLPPEEGGLNPTAGFTFMWHSHTEKELTNFDIFPGGMMAMLIVEPPGVEIP